MCIGATGAGALVAGGIISLSAILFGASKANANEGEYDPNKNNDVWKQAPNKGNQQQLVDEAVESDERVQEEEQELAELLDEVSTDTENNQFDNVKKKLSAESNGKDTLKAHLAKENFFKEGPSSFDQFTKSQSSFGKAGNQLGKVPDSCPACSLKNMQNSLNNFKQASATQT